MGIWILVEPGRFECSVCRSRCDHHGETCTYFYCPRCGIRMNLVRSMRYHDAKKEAPDEDDRC